jgi:hypothetical protein
MLRRAFIAALPAAAASILPLARAGEALPKFQPNGAGSFDRPDLHAGDRPAGASFASRSAAYGCSGAADKCIEHRMNGTTRVYAAASEMRADGMALAI